MSVTDATTLTVHIAETLGGIRLDKALAEARPDLSRTRLKSLIGAGHVTVNGRTINDPSYRVKGGETVAVALPPAHAAKPAPQDIAVPILYEDDWLLVVNKPAGLVVHPAAGNPDRTLVNALLAHCAGRLSGIGGVKRPGIVHRLDKDTSGLMVVAKTDSAHQRLAAQFTQRTIERAYDALVWGLLNPLEGEISGAIGRSATDRKKMAVVGDGGKAALTRYRTRRAFGTLASLVECRLATGRTHQIRVHMAHRGHPVVGDLVYGRRGRRPSAALSACEREAAARLKAFPRQALHARVLGFRHPETSEPLRFETELPNDIKELIDYLEKV